MKKVIWGFMFLIMIELLSVYWFFIWRNKSGKNEVQEIVYQLPTPEPLAPIRANMVLQKKPVAVATIKPKPTLTPTDSDPWGVSKQVGEMTWTIKVGQDEIMATPKEILEALNQYRQVHGSQILTWDDKLANFAQTRAAYLSSIKTVDQHKGFSDYMEKQDGFNKLGFTYVGENISHGYKLNGVHTIEWMYAGDEPHNENQLNTRWNYVGVGVDGLATSIIFGTGKR
ncbi:MAG: CAP domain-containing protein [Candidatus Shapirobacteria bacterium]